MAKIMKQNKLSLQYQLFSELKGLFYHQLKIEGVTPFAERFLKEQLFKSNCVAYDAPTDMWYAVSGVDENEYGDPTNLLCTSANGKTIARRKASYEPNDMGTFYIRFSPFNESWEAYTNHIATCLADIKFAILQNAKAQKVPMIVGVEDRSIKEEITKAFQEVDDGSPLVVVSENAQRALAGQATNVSYVGGELVYLYNEIRNTYLTRIGMLTRVNNTQQRIQSAQVYAVVGEAHDSIHSYIDYWNAQMESFGLGFTMSLNGCLDEVYTQSLIIKADDGDGSEGEIRQSNGGASFGN